MPTAGPSAVFLPAWSTSVAPSSSSAPAALISSAALARPSRRRDRPRTRGARRRIRLPKNFGAGLLVPALLFLELALLLSPDLLWRELRLLLRLFVCIVVGEGELREPGDGIAAGDHLGRRLAAEDLDLGLEARGHGYGGLGVEEINWSRSVAVGQSVSQTFPRSWRRQIIPRRMPLPQKGVQKHCGTHASAHSLRFDSACRASRSALLNGA